MSLEQLLAYKTEKMDRKPAWVTSDIWDFKNLNSNSPMFNATFNMFMLDGSAAHKHTIRL
jgi:hypothetical protein